MNYSFLPVVSHPLVSFFHTKWEAQRDPSCGSPFVMIPRRPGVESFLLRQVLGDRYSERHICRSFDGHPRVHSGQLHEHRAARLF